MRSCKLIAASTLLAFAGSILAPRLTTAQDKGSTASLVASTQAFIATLDAEQKTKALLSYDSPERVKWQFIPLPTRKGLPMMEMKPEQQTAAKALLKSAVSQLGYDRSVTIMSLENVLRKLEGPTSHERRNPEKYYFTVYGEVGKHWGLSIEGHHLSLNFVIDGDKIVDSTPQFFATNPAELKDTYGDTFPKGLRVIKEEEALGFDLLGSLSADQRKQATIAGDTPAEILSINAAQVPKIDVVGIKASALNKDQQTTLRKLLEAYTSKMRSEVAAGRWELINSAGFDKITFGWSGSDRAGAGHYYRIQGPTFLVEFINVQADAAGNPANHIHCVWRDMTGDFDLPPGT
ncbi:MAG: DUF3500 domain-containing protein [Pirellulales bacterium]